MGMYDSVGQHLQTPQPYATLMFALAWSYVHHNLFKNVIRFAVPHRTYSKLQDAWSTDRRLLRMSAVNSVAFLHAVVIVPLALLALCDKTLTQDIPHGCNVLFRVITWITGGYFVWDMQTCLRHVHVYGAAFLAHAVLSVVAVYSQGATERYRYAWYTLVFILTECSTPLLHMRWFAMKARDMQSEFFRIVNMLFIGAFAFFRLFFVEAVCILPFFWRVLKQTDEYRYIGARKLSVIAFIILAWLGLNVYWGSLLVTSQLRRLMKPRRSTTIVTQRAKVPSALGEDTLDGMETASSTPETTMTEAQTADFVTLTESMLGNNEDMAAFEADNGIDSALVNSVESTLRSSRQSFKPKED